MNDVILYAITKALHAGDRDTAAELEKLAADPGALAALLEQLGGTPAPAQSA